MNETRTCMTCGSEFEGMGCYVFMRTNTSGFSMRRLEGAIMCIDCGSNGGNTLPYFKYADQSVSSGTMATEDLIAAFGPVLKDIDPEAYVKIFGDSILMAGTRHAIVEELFEALDTLAPTGYYFGAIEGDGADYGFWRNDA